MEQTKGELRSDSDKSVSQPSIADPYADLLDLLNRHQRQGLVIRLTVGYYDGWRPSRSEVADLVAVTLKIMTIEESLQRQRIRNAGGKPVNIADRLAQARRHERR